MHAECGRQAHGNHGSTGLNELLELRHRAREPVVQGVVLVTAAVYVLVNLAVDVLYVFIDPRIRYG